jgi:uncharacterized membrane protein YhaH (DUF805 family)
MGLLIQNFAEAWKRSFDYSGRSKRPEYWWFYLANFLVGLLLALLSNTSDLFGWILSLYFPASIVPTLPLTIRRLRDSGKAWPWIFIGLIPIVGTIWLIVLLCQPSALLPAV